MAYTRKYDRGNEKFERPSEKQERPSEKQERHSDKHETDEQEEIRNLKIKTNELESKIVQLQAVIEKIENTDSQKDAIEKKTRDIETKVDNLMNQTKPQASFFNYVWSFFNPVSSTNAITTTSPSTIPAPATITPQSTNRSSEPQLVCFMATKQFPLLHVEFERLFKIKTHDIPYGTPVESLANNNNMDGKLILYVIYSSTDRPTPKWDEFEKLKNLSKDKTVLLVLRLTDNPESLGSWHPQPKGEANEKFYSLSTFNKQVKVTGLVYHEPQPEKKPTLLICTLNKNQLQEIRWLVG